MEEHLLLAVIVLDCAEHTGLRALSAAGRAPALASLAERGVTMPLRSDADVLDGSVFQTLLTGVNPGQHGICKYRQIRPGTYRYRMSEAAWSPAPQVWQVLSAWRISSLNPRGPDTDGRPPPA